MNDAHGHLVGDAVLRELAGALRNGLRRTDLVTRWGGEEFAIAYLDTPGPAAAGQVRRVQEQVAQGGLTPPGGPALRLTISAGVAASPADGADLETLVRAADGRLLVAKREGRNRVVDRDPG